MPFFGLTPFLPPISELKLYRSTDVSMPFFGLTPFLQWWKFHFWRLGRKCQCPSSGLLHFYGRRLFIVTSKLTVSMPFFGLTPFLLPYLYWLPLIVQGVNALLRAYSISTHARAKQYLWCCVCVNALLRAYSISTIQQNHLIRQNHPVSMPFFGLTPFLHESHWRQNNVSRRVNALLRAYSISTIKSLETFSFMRKCQCPSSGLLHFYSTLWEPSVYAASQTHFCK